MNEIVVIGIGNCGCQISAKFWELISNEHGITAGGTCNANSLLQKEKINVYFNEKPNGKYSARSMFIDLDPKGLDPVKKSYYKQIFDSKSYVNGACGTSHNWAAGRYADGLLIANNTEDFVRRLVEECDCLQGFQIIQNLGGGTASGFGAFLMDHLKENYTEKVLSTYCILPSLKFDITTQAYNCLLGMNYLTDVCDLCFCLSNDAVAKICTESLEITPSYRDLNYIIASTMAGISAPSRVPCQMNSNLSKLQVNMVPFPKLHFFIHSYSPITRQSTYPKKKLYIPSIIHEIFSYSNIVTNCDPKNGTYLSAAIMFSGRVLSKDVWDCIKINDSTSGSDRTMDWIRNNVKTDITEIHPRNAPVCATFVGNSTAINGPLKQIREKAVAMFNKKTFLHQYISAGLEIAEFDDASKNLLNLMAEYQSYEKDQVSTILSKIGLEMQDLVDEEIYFD